MKKDWMLCLLAFAWPFGLSGQAAQPFSAGKTLAQLREAVFSEARPAFLSAPPQRPHLFRQPVSTARPSPTLPRWSADDLPFFCKIEHNWAKKLPILLKFRLGSVEYVDWLEGKNQP
jgi:hypothetical protein